MVQTPPSNLTPKGFPPRARRTRSFWEPIFDPTDTLTYPPVDFSTLGTVIQHATVKADDLKSFVEKSKKKKFKGITFDRCDFSGVFDCTPGEVVWEDCVFRLCDFGLSTWKRAKFSKCKFEKISLSQSTWEDCEFRSSNWRDIGLSGNETDFLRTTITNPAEFIAAAYTNLDPGVLKGRAEISYQEMRLEGTKATVARKLVRIFLDHGDEGAYYEAVKTAYNQSVRSRIAQANYDQSRGGFWNSVWCRIRVSLSFTEMAIMNGAGLVNDWGRSIIKPLTIGVLLVLAFALLYWWVAGADPFLAFVRSLEVTLLAGYTNHSPPSMNAGPHVLVLANMMFGLAWYAVMIPTIVNRISRVR